MAAQDTTLINTLNECDITNMNISYNQLAKWYKHLFSIFGWHVMIYMKHGNTTNKINVYMEGLCKIIKYIEIKISEDKYTSVETHDVQIMKDDLLLLQKICKTYLDGRKYQPPPPSIYCKGNKNNIPIVFLDDIVCEKYEKLGKMLLTYIKNHINREIDREFALSLLAYTTSIHSLKCYIEELVISYDIEPTQTERASLTALHGQMEYLHIFVYNVIKINYKPKTATQKPTPIQIAGASKKQPKKTSKKASKKTSKKRKQ